MAKPLPLRSYLALHARSERQAAQRLRRLEASGAISMAESRNRLARDLPETGRGEMVWFHAATKDAAGAAAGLFETLSEERPGLTGLLTAARGVSLEAPPYGMQQVAMPEETESVVLSFLEHFSPSVLCWIGDGFRPSLLWHARSRGVKILAIETARAAPFLDIDSAFPGLRGLVRQSIDLVIAGTASSAREWRAAVANSARVEKVGYLEQGGHVGAFNEDRYAAVSRELGTRPAWFAAQVSAGEAVQVLRAHEEAMRRAHRLLLVLSLSDEAALSVVQQQSNNRPLRCAVYVDGGPIPEEAQVLITPADEDAGLWYRAASISYLGGAQSSQSALPPLQAVAHGSAIIHGPNVADQNDIFDRLGRAGATRVIRGESDLADAVSDLLAPDAAAKAAHAAWDVTSAGAMVSERAIALLHECLDDAEAMGA